MPQALIGLLRTMRPKQWTKNGVIFAGLVFDGQLLVLDSFVRVFISFILLCFAASTIYIVNDLVDIESDRQHPKKKKRPLPSGQLPIPLARAAAVAFPVIAVGGALLYSPPLALVYIFYIALHIWYSIRLKHVVLIDVMAITAGFILRVAAGVVVIPVEQFSPWLYVCTGLLAMFLAVGKRRQELILLGENASQVRPIFKHYNLNLLDDMLRIVTTSTLMAYTMYAIEEPSRALRGTNLALITVPFVVYSIFRYLYLIHAKGEGGAPDEVLLRDRPLQIAIALWGLTFIGILYLPRAA